jgi:hypothetical protein
VAGSILKNIFSWWRSLFPKEVEPSIAQKVLVTLPDDQMVTGLLVKHRPYGLQIERASIASGGKFVPLPYPSVVVVPSRRILMVQHLPDDAVLEALPVVQ